MNVGSESRPTLAKTGLPAQIAEQFADKQIYTKTVNRIENLKAASSTWVGFKQYFV